MGTERYVPPQRRVQTDDSANIEETTTGSVAKAGIEQINDRGGAKCKLNPDWMMKDTMQEIITFEAARLEVGPNAVESNTDSELLCTYNWISSRSSAIYVPGAPPIWTPKHLPVTLPMNWGLYCPQQAAYRPPMYPYEPLYKALSIIGPESNFKDTDLVTNRRCLQVLFQFASGNPFQDFRIDLHMVHNTLFLTRREQKTYFVVNACGTTKVGSNFESAFTTSEPGIEDSSSHHRVLRYTLGDLNCVVRFEADACCNEKQNDPQALDQGCVNLFSSLSEENIRAKCKQLFSTESGEAAAAAGNISAGTSVVLGGRIVPSSTMAELKTSQSENFCIAKHLPQLWFGRTPNLIIGTHTDGTFHKLEAVDLGKQLLEWERTHQEQLRKLTWLIAELRKTVGSTPGWYCILVGKGKGRKATVYGAAKRTSVLRDSIVKQFWR